MHVAVKTTRTPRKDLIDYGKDQLMYKCIKGQDVHREQTENMQINTCK